MGYKVKFLSSIGKNLSSAIKRNLFILLFFIVFSSSALILINYFSIKVLAAGRAFINGESSYAKGQKDALYNLVLYINTEDERKWHIFKQNMDVPFGDSIARVELTKNGDYSVIEKGFLQGRNHIDDIPNVIWLFKNFKNTPFMKKAILLWKQADYLNFKLYQKADSVRGLMKQKKLSLDERMAIIQSLDRINTELTQKQLSFSGIMSHVNREATGYLFIANFFLTFVIIGSVGIYSIIMMSRLLHKKSEIENKNHELTKINKDLDNFVYTASHDLKSPIANLEGLLTAFRKKVTPKMEQEEDKLLVLMEASVNRFKNTLKELTEITKISKSTNDDHQLLFFDELLEEIKEDLIKDIVDTKAKIVTDFQVKDIYFSRINLKSVIHNLVTNSIKYRSPNRAPMIYIKTKEEGENTVLIVSDNGLGFDVSKKDKMFSMFKRLHNHVEGTGLGLYIVKRIIEDGGGQIEVESEIGEGSKFKLYFAHSLASKE